MKPFGEKLSEFRNETPARSTKYCKHGGSKYRHQFRRRMHKNGRRQNQQAIEEALALWVQGQQEDAELAQLDADWLEDMYESEMNSRYMTDFDIPFAVRYDENDSYYGEKKWRE